MPDLFTGLFDSAASTSGLAAADFLLCVGASLALGLLIALFSSYKTPCSKSFFATLVLLPAIVCVVILMVNGNIGAGVAVAGAFSLVRFRSVPGSAREIAAIFLAMAAGLVTGMGYIGYAALFVLIIGLAGMALAGSRLGQARAPSGRRTLRITIPEDLDYTGVFDDLFGTYTTEHSLTQVKTTNMGSLFKLSYKLTLRDPLREKEFIDQLRCRNGNLEISASLQEAAPGEL